MTPAPPDPAPILLVEDDPAVRRMVKAALTGAGLEVESAADGSAAAAILAARRPALLLLDLGLPGVDGAVVGAAARAAYGEGLPIIVISGQDRAAERGHHLGARATLAKPFRLEELVAAIRTAL